MRESIGSTFLYSIIFVFIIIVMGLLTATLNYYKGYKVNSYILRSIEKYSGYNEHSIKDIDRITSGIGYTSDVVNNCPNRDGTSAISSDKSYCLYYFTDERSNTERNKGITNRDGRPVYYSYGVTTYISVELPIVGRFRVPVYSKGERIYRFTGSCQVDGDEGCSKI